MSNPTNHKEVFETPVFPVPPAFTQVEPNPNDKVQVTGSKLDFVNIARYVKYLGMNKVQVVMSTAGTSGYNLLSFSEILHFNRIILESFPGTVVVGVPEYGTEQAKEFVDAFKASVSEEDLKRVYFMWLYPERYYNDEAIVSYFYELTNYADMPCLFHGKPIKHARHGYNQDFEAALINKIAEHPNIVGMKEESSHMAKATQVVTDVNTDEFSVIVAGGSMSRFEMQKSNGAVSFLTGVGSLFPEYELEYFKNRDGDAATLRPFLAAEEKCFEVLMGMGWHLGFRTALQEMGLYEPYTRSPFPLATEEQRQSVIRLVNTLAKDLSLNTTIA